jgi:RNA polymerase-binding transcription factor DksA
MDSAAVRTRLTAGRLAAAQRIATLTRDFNAMVAASRDANADDEHDPEGATIAFERAQVTALIEQAQRQLLDFDTALDRLDRDDYGICERCGAVISDARLTARPASRFCIDCASRAGSAY